MKNTLNTLEISRILGGVPVAEDKEQISISQATVLLDSVERGRVEADDSSCVKAGRTASL